VGGRLERANWLGVAQMGRRPSPWPARAQHYGQAAMEGLDGPPNPTWLQGAILTWCPGCATLRWRQPGVTRPRANIALGGLPLSCFCWGVPAPGRDGGVIDPQECWLKVDLARSQALDTLLAPIGRAN